LALGCLLAAMGCDPEAPNQGDAGAVDARDLDAPDAPPPPPHADPTPAAIAYFADIDESLMGMALVDALHTKLSDDHVSVAFADLVAAYSTTDTDRDGCAGIFDFYSSKCWQPAEACGNYQQEGDCFNREHSWPKSWWGGLTEPDQHQDIVAVIPADGFVNNVRGQLDLGDIVNPDYTSTNGSQRGRCAADGSPPGSMCFEPPDELKGDLARIYFYVAVRYEGDFSCCAESSVERSDIRPWQEMMLRRWHAADPVDIDERERNERVFGLQQNRNPFVDFPVFLERIDDL